VTRFAESGFPDTVDPRAAHAFGATRLDRDAVVEAELAPINVDVRATVNIVLSSLPRLREFRTLMEKLPGLDLKQHDRLELYALALEHAHALYLVASGPAAPLSHLAQELAKARDLLVADAMVLEKRGLLTGRSRGLRGHPGQQALASEVLGLAALFRANLARLVGKTAIDVAELSRVEELAERLRRAIRSREDRKQRVAEATRARQRAFTLVIRSCDQARRALAYLRWYEHDASQIAPSLYGGRGGRGKAHGERPPSTRLSNPLSKKEKFKKRPNQ